jgi:putative lipoic acid-binding regulatory protein
MTTEKKSPLTFPCDFPIKVFGLGTEEFETTVLMIVHKHFSHIADTAIQSRASENGKYRAMTIMLKVNSQEQLDAIYKELSASPAVLMVL